VEEEKKKLARPYIAGPMIQDVNETIERTHRLTGKPRNQIIESVFKRGPLYAAPLVGLPLLDDDETGGQ
jgi:hypothetical protein